MPEVELAPGATLRLRLDLGYDGSGFAGWARQPNQRTVQGVLEEALGRILRTSVALTVAGRTDAGVHATGQVVHLDLPAAHWRAVPGRGDVDPGTSLVRRLAGVLPADVRVHRARPAPRDFDARFGALARHYLYRICDAPSGAPPLRRSDTLWQPRSVELARLREASAGLLGEHDFAAYCRRRAGATTVRRLLRLEWAREPGGIVLATVAADAFCHSMVRSLIGALLAVGEGRRPVEWPRELLTRTEREGAVSVAPAHGLTLVGVDYPPDDQLAERVATTRRRRVPTVS